MKKLTCLALCLCLVAALALAGCGGSSAGYEPVSTPEIDKSAVLNDARMRYEYRMLAGKATRDILQPTGVLYQDEAAFGKIDESNVFIFRIIISSTAEAVDGFVAVASDMQTVFFSTNPELSTAVFKATRFDRDTGRYSLLDATVRLGEYEVLDTLSDAGGAGAMYSVPQDWLEILRDATYADYEAQVQENPEWGLQYCDNLLAFFAETSVLVPGAYATRDSLNAAIENYTGDSSEILYRVVCGIMGLEKDYYYDFILIVAGEPAS